MPSNKNRNRRDWKVFSIHFCLFSSLSSYFDSCTIKVFLFEALDACTVRKQRLHRDCFGIERMLLCSKKIRKGFPRDGKLKEFLIQVDHDG